jgi:transcription termination factor Rho
MHLNELKALHVSEVFKQAEALEIENTGRMRKQELMFAIIKKRARAGEQVFADGVLEVSCQMASASCVRLTPATTRRLTTSTFRPARSDASTCTQVT